MLPIIKYQVTTETQKGKHCIISDTILLCTGHSSLIDEDKANLLGISGYIMKPVSKSKIAESIREALDR